MTLGHTDPFLSVYSPARARSSGVSDCIGVPLSTSAPNHAAIIRGSALRCTGLVFSHSSNSRRSAGDSLPSSISTHPAPGYIHDQNQIFSAREAPFVLRLSRSPLLRPLRNPVRARFALAGASVHRRTLAEGSAAVRVRLVWGSAHAEPSGQQGYSQPALGRIGSRPMRRPPPEVVDALTLVFKGMRAWSDGEGNRLPAHSVNVLLFLGLKPDGKAAFADVWEAFNLGQSRTSRIIAALVRAGLVSATTPKDKRRTDVALTPRGLRAVDRIADAVRSPDAK